MEDIVLREWVPIGALVRVLMVVFSFIIIFITIVLVGLGNLITEDFCGLIVGFWLLSFFCFGILEDLK